MTPAELSAAISSVERSISRLDLWILLFGAFVMVGVVGETIEGIRHWTLDRQLVNLQAAESRLHETQMGELRKEAAEAEDRAAQAELKIAELRKPRHKILEGHEASVAAALDPFKDVVFDIGMGPNDGEVEDFIWVLEPVLWNAGWKQIDWVYPGGFTGQIKFGGPGNSRPAMGSVAASNVMVELYPDAPPGYAKAADALVAQLTALGIEAHVVDPNIHNINTKVMHILVGPKR